VNIIHSINIGETMKYPDKKIQVLNNLERGLVLDYRKMLELVLTK